MTLINLTPHALNIQRAGGSTLTLPSASQWPARCQQTETPVCTIDGIAVTRQQFGAVAGLPEPQDGTRYIVSRIVAEAAIGRDDLLVPGPMLRDADGRVIGCVGLSVVTPAPALPANLARDVAEAGEYLRLTGGDMSDAAWHLASALRAIEALGVSVPELHRAHPEGLPPSLQKLGSSDSTVVAVTRLLTNDRLSPEARADARAVIETICIRWQCNYAAAQKVGGAV